MLIEEYVITLAMKQNSPVAPLLTSIYSKDIFNLNLTYGCILSIFKTLQFIKDEEKKVLTNESI